MNTSEYGQKILNHIEKSDLDADRKLLWEIFVKISNEEEDEAIYEAISESENNLVLLTTFLRDKIWSMQGTSPESWDKLFADKDKYIKFLSAI